MIEFTIKTLDSNNHNFQVEDEITVQELKEKVREQMGIEINLQRLIFCGRVLQDEKRLSEYDVNGKVVHLVQRAPPSPESRHGGQPANPGGSADAGTNGHQPRRSVHLLREEQINLPNVTGRLDFIRLMISEIKATLAILQGANEENAAAPAASSEANVENMDTDSAASTAQEENDTMMEEGGEAGAEAAARAQNARRRSHRAVRSLRARQSRMSQLAQLLEELDALQAQFAPHRAHLVRLLTEPGHAEPPVYTGPEREAAQRVVDLSLEIMHSLAHAYHAVSDLNYQVGQRSPRLTSEAVIRMPQMQQAHINVVQSNRRPAASAAAAAAPAAPGAPGAPGSAPATVTSPPATSAPTNTAQCPPAPGEEAPVQAGRNTTQPTVNINIQPDPITYQVEIETRVPIAFALENALMGGLGQGAQEPPADQPAPAAAAGQPGPNRRQVLFDFENLFRGLGQTGNLGGVEVVMSMEEIPNGGIVGQVPPGTGGPVGGQAPPTLQHIGMHHDGGVLLGPLPWGGAPSADLLQNIVSSVIRQGLLPQGEAVALQVAHGAPPPAPAADAPPQDAAHGPQTGGLQLRRATTTARATTLNSFIYDRYLLCMSRHARRRMLRRREQQQNQPGAPPRLPGTIDMLRQRNSNFNAAHIQTISDLFYQSPTRACYYNAFFVAVARHLLLGGAGAGAGAGAEGGVAVAWRETAETELVRRQLRHGLQELMLRAGGGGAPRLADHLADQLEDFLSQPELDVAFRAEYNVVTSMRALLRARLPAVVGCVMTEPAAGAVAGEVAAAAARRHALLAQLFADACALLAHCCCAGVDGMRAALELFLEQKCNSFGSSEVRDAVLTLGTESLRAVIDGLDAASPGAAVLQFIVRNDEPMDMPLTPTASSPERSAPPAPAPAPASAPAPAPAPPVAAAAAAAGASRAPDADQPSRSVPLQTSSPSRPERGAASTRALADAQLASFVPSMVVLQEWVPVLSRDAGAQTAAPPEPYSDAYLSGMPSRKRRCVRQARPPHTLEAFMAESVREASDRPAADTGAVRLAFREHMRSMARARASSSDEFDPLRYASAARFLKPDMKKEPKNEDNA